MPDWSRTGSCKLLSELEPGQTFRVMGFRQTIDGYGELGEDAHVDIGIGISAGKKRDINIDTDDDTKLLLYRLEQLGFRAGNQGICLYENMGKGSLAYRIQGSVIALRVEDAALVVVVCEEKEDGEPEICVMLTGNPNVGKSTVFNRLTGMRQHTGNWPGKTVELAEGSYQYGIKEKEPCERRYREKYRGQYREKNRGQYKNYRLIDLPGTYSLKARSEEEIVTTEALQSGKADVVVVVCDASCLERGLRFALEVQELCECKLRGELCSESSGELSGELCSELSGELCGELRGELCGDLRGDLPVIICVNLCDEAEKKGIQIDFELLEQLTECKVVSASAARGKGLEQLKQAIAEASCGICEKKILIKACEADENRGGITAGENPAKIIAGESPARRTAGEDSAKRTVGEDSAKRAAFIVEQTVQIKNQTYWHRDYGIDRFLTSPVTGSICMLGMLFVLFWLTMKGANYPSALLSTFFGWIGDVMEAGLTEISCPELLKSLWLDGVWRVSSWVVSVMLPPMAIFFPLFTILEDLGYLPRVAFHLDGCFKKCHACGKQALTMCMGLGCNAVGVTGCRIIDTKKERLLAILTNSLIPCNGRFPALIALITMFFAGGSAWAGGLLMCLAILLAVGMTFLVTRLLAAVLNKGKNSTFILELPPYRKPQFGQILIRSLVDRTLFVLSRAILAAAPAGLIIWLLANIQVAGVSDISQISAVTDRSLAGHTGGISLLQLFTSWLEYPASFIGLDGAILFAFILGFPANEIVLPAVLMCYMARGSLVEVPALDQLRLILIDNGWTVETALCMLLFTLFHWPCATTCMTIHKETGSWKWTAAAFLLPAICGCVLCGLVHMIFGFTEVYLGL